MEKKLIAPLRIDFAGGWIDLPDFHNIFQGYVVNAAISPHIRLNNGKVDFSPYHPGGGVSSSTGALILNFLESMSKYSSNGKIYSSPVEFAETVYRLENHMIDFKIGRQDQYAITLGGINVLRFGKDSTHINDFEIEEHITSYDSNVRSLEDHLLLVHSGIKRPAQGIVEIVRRNIANNDKNALEALRDIADCGKEAAQIIRTGKYSLLADTMSRNWQAQKRLVPECSSDQIDKVYDHLMANGAIGGKMCGCGGGGYFIFYCSDVSKVRTEAENLGLQVIEPKFEMSEILKLNDLTP